MTRKQCDLKKKLRVTFVGEAGLDLGGLTKEWFLLLVRQIFHTDYGESQPDRPSATHPCCSQRLLLMRLVAAESPSYSTRINPPEKSELN